jgi:hypothetical protein
MATPSAPTTAGQATTPSTPATPGLAANLVARDDLPTNTADWPTLRATLAPRWARNRDSSAETVRAHVVLPRQRPLTPRPHAVAQRRTPSEVQAARASVASSSTGPMGAIRTDVQDSGRARRSSISARPATSQDYRLTEEERAASRTSAAARAADRSSARSTPDRLESSLERADLRWADRARTLRIVEDAATRASAIRAIRDELEEGFEQAPAAA